MCRVGVVGAGIAGLAHTWMAAKTGCQVTVFERNQRAEGASVRNFGMVWPIGQPYGPLHELAIRSRQCWHEASVQAGFCLSPCGSLHVAHHDDELAVLEEYANLPRPDNVLRRLVSANEVRRLSPAINPIGLRGGLFSDSELGVNPRIAIPSLARWLDSWSHTTFHYGCPVVEVSANSMDQVHVRTALGESHVFDRVIICSGAELWQLFPAIIADAEMKLCKLQMLRTSPQPSQWRLGPHIASGLTLRHYPAFKGCPSLQLVRERIASQHPELDQFGIHVMAAQTESGEVILGDSHEYDEQIEPFDKSLIDELIIRELGKILNLPNWQIDQRWHGTYLKMPTDCWWMAHPIPRVSLFNGLGGMGMTMAFGIAEKVWRDFGSPENH